MELRQLEYILTIIKTNYNLTKAAEILNISQPALSKMITTFEHEMEVKIFVREKGRLVGITSAGEILISHAHAIVSQYNNMIDNITYYSKKITGRVRIGISTSLLQVLFDDILPKIILQNPAIQFDIIELTSKTLEKRFLADEIDILVTLSGHDIQPFHYHSVSLASEPYIAIMNMNHPLMQHQSLKWQHLENIKLAIPPSGYLTHSLVTERMEAENLSPRVIISTSSSEILIKSTIDSDIVTILPKIFYQKRVQSDEPLSCIPFEKAIHWNVEMLINKKHLELKNHIYLVYNQIKDLVLLSTQ